MNEFTTQSSGANTRTRWRSVFFFGFGMLCGLGILSGIFYFSNSSFTQSRNGLLAQTSTILKGALHDMIGVRASKPTLEIDLKERSIISTGRSMETDEKNNQVSNLSDTSRNSVSSKAKSPLPTPAPNTGSKSKSHTATKEVKNSSSTDPQNTITETKLGADSPLCDFDSNQLPNHSVLINEIAWMGTATSSNDEWIELRNNSGNLVEFRNWQLVNENGKFRIVFGDSDKLPTNSFYLMERSSDDTVPNIPANKIYLGAISNSSIILKFFDSSCKLVDEVDALNGWKKLGGDNTAKKTLERNVRDFDWHTSSVIDGTPGKKNDDKFSATTNILSSGNAKYNLIINKSGAGAGVVISSPSGISCGMYCSLGFSSGASIILSAVPDDNSLFSGWDVASCSGTGDCQVLINKNMEITAVFDKSSSSSESANNTTTTAASSTNPANNPGTSNQVVISEIMAGSDLGSDDEFVELWNRGLQTTNLTGWSIKKKTSSGSESTLASASRLEGKSIPTGKKFLMVNEGGYKGGVAGDASWARSNTLAYSNNSVVLYDGNGNKIDEVTWSEITKNQSYERQSDSFVNQPNPNPQNSSQ